MSSPHDNKNIPSPSPEEEEAYTGAETKTTPADLSDDLDEEATLKKLSATARDQDDLEQNISHQAGLALIEAENKKDETRIAKTRASKLRLENQKKIQEEKLRKAWGNAPLKTKIQQEIARLGAEIELLDNDIADFNARIEERNNLGPDEDTGGSNSKNSRLPGESQREFLIRTGKITPFSKIGGPRPEGIQGELANAIIDAEEEALAEELEDKTSADQPRSHRNLRLPGFAEAEEDKVSVPAAESEFSLRPRKKRKIQKEVLSDDDFEPPSAASPESDFAEESDDYDMTNLTRETPRKTPRGSKSTKGGDEKVDFSKIDDGDESIYQWRLSDWVERRSRARQRNKEREGLPVEEDDEEEWHKPSPDEPDHQLDNGLRIPGDIYPSLFDYQKTGVQWLAELFDQKVGGIVGDEMGLGKTIQVISFLAALHYSKKVSKPVLVVAPATVLQQWVSEFHRWWPPMRVSILHSSGSGMLNIGTEERYEEEELWDEQQRPKKSSKAAKKVVDRVVKQGHVLVTTYAGLQSYGDVLIPVEWEYVVLDEGHKIRNPNTQITIYCKELLTPNRIILSGTPMQNNLVELWSLFDFINPMRLGSLVAFRDQFETPIRIGGYANASNLQVMTAQKCAETLKDTISPYLLSRTKKDVAADLPKKSEQVLFCKLTKYQRDMYEYYIQTQGLTSVLNKTRPSFHAIDYLRKICNHPDLVNPKLKNKAGHHWGSANNSGKMQVVKALVQMWKRIGHKTLLFTQGRQMLDILEAFVRRQKDIGFLRMDGATPIKERQKLVDRFNSDPNVHLFLLTTRVGGLGVNLTGANRVIIYDPDWNPSVDVQARERAWRLGQKKEVTIYRLMTAGTIEEKIYQRQIFKQFLANKVLNDPKQRTTLNLSDMHDLFTLGSDENSGTETGQLFKGTEVKANIAPKITPGDRNVDLPDQHAHISNVWSQNGADEADEKLQDIDGVAGLAEYKGEDGDDDPDGQEDRIMAGIFAKSVHEALEHDAVVNGKRIIRADPAMLKREADRVAREAAQHLRRSGEQARQVSIGTVTWTGEVGETGRPRPANIHRSRGGPSSSSILAGIRNRQGLSNGEGSSSGRTPGGLELPARGGRSKTYGVNDFEEMIPPFIQQHGGKVPSKVLVDHFNRYCPTRKTTEAFKLALDNVARMEQKGSTMRAIWSLKSKYR